MTSTESLRLLGTVHVGRIAFSYRALPGIQAVSHLIDNGDVIIRSHGRPPVISPALAGTVVLAYEADAIDPEKLSGWLVTVTGHAGMIRDPDDIARYHQALPAWPIINSTGQLIRLRPGLMSGYRFLGLGSEPADG